MPALISVLPKIHPVCFALTVVSGLNQRYLLHRMTCQDLSPQRKFSIALRSAKLKLSFTDSAITGTQATGYRKTRYLVARKNAAAKHREVAPATSSTDVYQTCAIPLSRATVTRYIIYFTRSVALAGSKRFDRKGDRMVVEQSQQDRRGSLTTAMSEDVLALVRFDGSDGVNELFEYRV